MATTILIVCPECAKQIKAPENVLGKKVRCKFCQAAFVASKGGGNAAGKPAKPAAGKAAKAPPVKPAPVKPSKPAMDDEDDDPNPYGMLDVHVSSRCPDCANDMEEGAIICLICGYNTQTRERHRTVKTYDNTVGEQVAWLLPGIICVLVIIGLIIFNIWYLMKIDEIVGDDAPWYLAVWTSGGIKLWVVIMSLGVIFFTGRFAVKRLILHYSKPEVEKTK
jgi:hypothetical protein